MRGHLGDRERVRFRSAFLSHDPVAESGSLALMDDGAAAEVGEGERGLTVSAVGRAEQREESGVLADGEELPVALGPSLRREVEGDPADLADKRLLGLSGGGREGERGDDECESAKLHDVSF
jgi:hypothetical protein